MLARSFIPVSIVLLICSLVHAASTTQPTVAVFDLSGQLSEQPVDNSLPIFGPQPKSLREVVSHMDKAAKDPAVKAAVILADTQITDTTMAKLAKLKLLNKLDIAGCGAITEDAIKNFKKALPKCTLVERKKYHGLFG